MQKGEAGRELFPVLRAQSGDRDALDALLASVQGPLYRYVPSLVRERHAAEDVLQEAFIRMRQKLGWLREPELFRAWDYRVATREAFRRLKRERRRAEQFRDEGALRALSAPPPREELAGELSARRAQLQAGLLPGLRLGGALTSPSSCWRPTSRTARTCCSSSPRSAATRSSSSASSPSARASAAAWRAS